MLLFEFRPIQTIDGHLALFGADASAINQLDKHLRFFSDRAAKKWPLRGSLKYAGVLLAYPP